MNEREEYLVAVVGADITQFRAGMRDVRSELGLLDERTGATLARIGRTLTYTLSVPIIAAGTAFVQQASQFDASMRNINSIALLSEDSFAKLSQEVLNFGMNTRSGAEEASKALYTIYSAGLSGSQAMELMKISVKTAEAGLADLTTTSEALSSVILSFGFTTEQQSMRASNALTRLVQLGVGSMQDFAGSIATFIPSAAALGVSLEESFALDARLTQMGYGASEAAVRVNAAMRSMIKPSSDMSAAFNQLGVHDAEGLIKKFGGLQGALIALKGTTDGTAGGLAKLFSDTRAMQGVLLLTQNVDKTASVIAEFNKNLDSATMDAWNQQTQSFAYQFDKAKSAAQGLAISLGSVLLPVIAPILGLFTSFAQGLAKSSVESRGLAVAIAAVVAIGAPLLWLIGSLMSPFGLIIAGLGALKRAWDTNFMGIATTVKNFVAQITTTLAPVKDVISGIISDVFGSTTPTDTTIPTVNVPVPVTYTVKEGDSFWAIWSANFRDQYPTFQDFVTNTGIDTKAVIHPGDVLNLTGSSTSLTDGVTDLLTYSIDHGIANTNTGYVPAVPLDFWGKVGAALSKSGTKLKEALDSALTTLVPQFDTFVGSVFNQIAAAFTRGNTGKGGVNPVYNGIRDTINNAGDKLGGDIQTNFPNMIAGLGNMMKAIGDWLVNTGIPTVARSIGYVAGTIGVLIGQALGSVWDAIKGGAPGQAADGVNKAIIQPLNQGMNDAFKDNNMTGADVGTKVVTGITGAIGTAILANTLLFTGIGTALKGAIMLGINGITWGVGIFAPVVGRMLLALGAEVVLPIATFAATFAINLIGSMIGVTGLPMAFSAVLGWMSIVGIPGFITAATALLAGLILPVALFTIALGGLALIFTNKAWADDFTKRMYDLMQAGGFTKNPAGGLTWHVAGLTIDFGAKPVQPTEDQYKTTADDFFQKPLEGGTLTVKPATVKLDTSKFGAEGMITGSIEVPANIKVLQNDASRDKLFTDNPLVKATKDLGNDPALQPQIDAVTTQFVSDLSTGISTSMSGGVVKKEDVVANIAQPIYDALFPYVGEGGSIRLMWSGFVSTVMNGGKDIANTIKDLVKTAPADLAKLYTDALVPLEQIKTEFNMVTDAINSLAIAITGLHNLTLIPVMAAVPPDSGGSSDTGGDISGDSQGFGKSSIPANYSSHQTSQKISNEIHIHGVTSATEVIRVLADRGIHLVRK